MFDRIVQAPTTRFPDTITVNVHEKRAPTDDSVRILREMEDAARRQVSIEAIPGNNVLGAVCTYRSEARQQTFVAFELNGQKIVAGLPDAKLARDGHEAVRLIAEHVTEQIMDHVLHATMYTPGTLL